MGCTSSAVAPEPEDELTPFRAELQELPDRIPVTVPGLRRLIIEYATGSGRIQLWIYSADQTSYPKRWRDLYYQNLYRHRLTTTELIQFYRALGTRLPEYIPYDDYMNRSAEHQRAYLKLLDLSVTLPDGRDKALLPRHEQRQLLCSSCGRYQVVYFSSGSWGHTCIKCRFRDHRLGP